MTSESRFVSRAGEKLDAGLTAFSLDVSGLICVDFGSHTGGFVDCLLQRGAARVHAVDPSYGVLAYKLRRDPRVVVHERANALTFVNPELCDLATIDVGWTPQRLVLPAVQRSLRPNAAGAISLIKPQYEAAQALLRAGVLPDECRPEVLELCRADVRSLGWQILAEVESPIRGHAGNVEYLWHLRHV